MRIIVVLPGGNRAEINSVGRDTLGEKLVTAWNIEVNGRSNFFGFFPPGYLPHKEAEAELIRQMLIRQDHY